VRRAAKPEPEPYFPPILGLWAMSITDEVGDAAKQAMLRLKLRKEHGCGLQGQVVIFDRHDAAHAAVDSAAGSGGIWPSLQICGFSTQQGIPPSVTK
jgi:hypothetical protein